MSPTLRDRDEDGSQLGYRTPPPPHFATTTATTRACYYILDSSRRPRLGTP